MITDTQVISYYYKGFVRRVDPMVTGRLEGFAFDAKWRPVKICLVYPAETEQLFGQGQSTGLIGAKRAEEARGRILQQSSHDRHS